MPKTSVHKDNFFSSTEYQIGCSRQVGAVDMVSVAAAVNEASNEHLRFGIPAANTAHQRASLFRSKRIHL
jgi:hypothetical protein